MQAELTTGEITDVVEEVLEWVRDKCGGRIDAKSVDLRLWAAAALINSVFAISIEEHVRASVDLKLSILAGGRQH